MTQEEINHMVVNHERILKGNGQKGLMEKMDNLWDWFNSSRGRNSTIMFIKDVLITGGLLVFFIQLMLGKV